jgi:hypothetical protein
MITYDRLDRHAGKSKYPISKMLVLAIDGITSFSIHPLRWITAMGVVLSFFSLLVGVWALLVRSLRDLRPRLGLHRGADVFTGWDPTAFARHNW